MRQVLASASRLQNPDMAVSWLRVSEDYSCLILKGPGPCSVCSLYCRRALSTDLLFVQPYPAVVITPLRDEETALHELAHRISGWKTKPPFTSLSGLMVTLVPDDQRWFAVSSTFQQLQSSSVVTHFTEEHSLSHGSKGLPQDHSAWRW